VEANVAGTYGGGFWDGANNGVLTILNSFVLNNRAAVDGGGIVEANQNTLIANSTIDNNVALSGGLNNGFGGGLDLGGATSSVQVVNCRIDGNTGQWGGGLEDQAGALSVQNTTFQGNHAVSDIAGDGGRGGAIHVGVVSNLTVSNCLFLGN